MCFDYLMQKEWYGNSQYSYSSECNALISNLFNHWNLPVEQQHWGTHCMLHFHAPRKTRELLPVSVSQVYLYVNGHGSLRLIGSQTGSISLFFCGAWKYHMQCVPQSWCSSLLRCNGLTNDWMTRYNFMPSFNLSREVDVGFSTALVEKRWYRSN